MLNSMSYCFSIFGEKAILVSAARQVWIRFCVLISLISRPELCRAVTDKRGIHVGVFEGQVEIVSVTISVEVLE